MAKRLYYQNIYSPENHNFMTLLNYINLRCRCDAGVAEQHLSSAPRLFDLRWSFRPQHITLGGAMSSAGLALNLPTHLWLLLCSFPDEGMISGHQNL